MNIKTLLCFDYGSKRIGVAVGQSLTSTATPLVTIKKHGKKIDWQNIAKLIVEWNPDALIVGIPLCMDGTVQEMTVAAQKFCRQLQARFSLPVYGMDERLSSYEATQRTVKKNSIDAVAAQVILETWLSENSDNIVRPTELNRPNNV